jgi:hypothetical protein
VCAVGRLSTRRVSYEAIHCTRRRCRLGTHNKTNTKDDQAKRQTDVPCVANERTNGTGKKGNEPVVVRERERERDYLALFQLSLLQLSLFLGTVQQALP